MASRRNVIEYIIRTRDESSQELRSIETSVDNIGRAMRGLAGIIGATFSIRELVQAADTFRLLENRIRLVTETTGELVQVQRQLAEVSLRSRSSLEATTNLYARVARSSRELGISQEELLEFTETVNQAIQVSGSTAAEASAGVIQFSQALASSRLSGDELRSVMEQMPRLAQAIAEGLKINIGELRQWGEENKLTTDVVVEAIQRQAGVIQNEFGKIVPTIGQAMINLETATLQTIGVLDRFYGTSAAISGAIVELAGGLIDLGDALTGQLKPTQELSGWMEKLAIAILTAAAALTVLGQSLVATGRFLAVAAGETIGATIAAIRQAIVAEGAGISDIGQALQERLGAEFVNTFETLGDDLQLTLTNWMERVGMVLKDFPRIVGEQIDLSEGGPNLLGLDKNTRDAMEKAEDQLKKMAESLGQQAAAFSLAGSTGIDYAYALDIVKIRAMAAASGNLELAASVEALLEHVENLKAAEEARMSRAEAMTELMQELGEQAARNIQDAFADFLFDPFEKGVKGMVDAFLVAIRRMLAEAISFQILTGLFQGTRFGDFLLPRRAAGGPAMGPTLVGERGPEIVNLPRGSNITSNAAMQGMGGDTHFTTNIDARGADPGLIARLPAIFEQRDRQLKAAMVRFAETGVMPL